MLIATLIGAPKSSRLNVELANAVQAKLNGGAIKWLADREACEFEFQSDIKVEKIWTELQNQKIDLVVQKTKNRKKKILIADMDSTMIHEECIDELADLAGFGKECKAITKIAMNGEIEFEQAMRDRVALLSGMRVEIINQVISTRLNLVAGGKTLLSTMRANGAYAALVSGGFTDFTSWVADELNFDEHRANILLKEDGKLTGKAKEPILGASSKVQALEELAKKFAVTDDDVMAVGDGANDLGMIARAGSGVALHAKPAVAAQSEIKLNFADLTGLLFIQGYSQQEFVLK